MKLARGLEVRSRIPMSDPDGKPLIGPDGKQKVLILPATIKTIAIDAGNNEPVITLEFSSGKTFTIEGRASIQERIYVPDLTYIESLEI